MKNYFKRTKMLDEAKLQSKPFNPFIELLIFFAVFFVGNMAQSFIITPAMFVYLFTDADFISFIRTPSVTQEDILNKELEIMANLPDWFTIVTLFSTVCIIAAVIIYCRFIEKRKLSTLGFRKRHALTEYLVGLLAGLVMYSAVTAIGVLLGVFKFEGINNVSVPVILLFFLGYVIQGASEELLIHGYYMTSLSRSTDTMYALINSSVMFALLHFANNGISVLAFINLFLFGLLAGIYVLKRGNIWGVCALHTFWNFAQGNIFGFSVSGTSKTPSLMSFSVVEDMSRVTGGDFGPEGGLIVTLILFLALGALIILKPNKHEIAEIQPQTVTEEE